MTTPPVPVPFTAAASPSNTASVFAPGQVVKPVASIACVTATPFPAIPDPAVGVPKWDSTLVSLDSTSYTYDRM